VHPSGFETSTEPNHKSESCASCIWAHLRGPGTKKLRCVGTSFQRINPEWPACEHWTPKSLDCLDCGACCGPAFDVVEVSRQDPVRARQPDWIVKKDGRYQMKRRSNNTCQALQADMKCSIYSDRPQCCRDFERGSANCWFARRRIGLM
jgi:hypothetical protein